jgi:hypothetical protein
LEVVDLPKNQAVAALQEFAPDSLSLEWRDTVGGLITCASII